jgi:ABC-2 type transport system ATP-binding protein
VCGLSVVTQTREAKARVGYLPDNPPLYEEMRVSDYVDYVGKLRGLHGAVLRAAVEKVMQDCDVYDDRGRVIGHLSKGFKQRVALCAALVHNPEVLILDEPTEGLDPTQILQIRKLIRKLSKDRTVIMSSHILSEVQATCDDVIIINQGRIVAHTSLTDEATSKSQYEFRFASETERALSWFRDRKFVADAKCEGAGADSVTVWFTPEFWNDKCPDNVAKVNELLVKDGFLVAGIREQKRGIEELFFNAIKSNGQAAQA